MTNIYRIKNGHGYNDSLIVEIDNYKVYVFVHEDFKDLELISSFIDMTSAVEKYPEIKEMIFVNKNKSHRESIAPDYEDNIIYLKPRVMKDIYGELLEEQEIDLRDIEEVFVKFDPNNEAPWYWELYVRLYHRPVLHWGDYLGLPTVKHYLLNKEDLVRLKDMLELVE